VDGDRLGVAELEVGRDKNWRAGQHAYERCLVPTCLNRRRRRRLGRRVDNPFENVAGRVSLRLAFEHREQEVLGADVVAVHPKSLIGGCRHNAIEAKVRAWNSDPQLSFDERLHIGLNVHLHEHLVRYPVGLVQDRQEDVLVGYSVVMEFVGQSLRQLDYLSGRICHSN
jgi:hypothetical protein